MSDRTQNRNFALQIRYTVTNTTYTMEQSPGKANSSWTCRTKIHDRISKCL
jgi:hypothetical protein